jgi:polar amino acid transport system ATP-binding protein
MALVELRSVVKRYADHVVLKNVDLSLEKGEIIAIIGRSGSGKSTLLRCINGLESIQSGELFVDGVAVHDPKSDLRALRARVGFVFQSYNLFPHLDVERNITLGPTIVKGMPYPKAAGLARAALRRVGLEDKIHAYPDELSGGQQQRVAIARALVSQPSVVFADEPTGNLDSKTGGEILELLRASAEELNQTMVMVTHDANAATIADRVLFLADGVIVEELPRSSAADILAAMTRVSA